MAFIIMSMFNIMPFYILVQGVPHNSEPTYLAYDSYDLHCDQLISP
jgi:hypothetical protein